MQIKGILFFTNAIFTARQSKDAAGNPTGDPKYSANLLIAPNDPQVAVISAAVNTAIADTFPNGFPAKGDKCWMSYDDKFKGKDYYDPKFTGWWVFSCTRKQEDGKPAVVNEQLQPIMDPGEAFSGAVAWINAGISGYVKGTGGVGGWLNGVMITSEEPPMGRLDNRPSVEQMFANLPASHQQHLAAGAHVAANGATITMPQTQAAPTPPAPPAPVPPKPAATLLLTPAAGVGMTLEKMYEAGWTDEMMIQNGYAVRPSFV